MALYTEIHRGVAKIEKGAIINCIDDKLNKTYQGTVTGLNGRTLYVNIHGVAGMQKVSVKYIGAFD